jgi:hypothetical protein
LWERLNGKEEGLPSLGELFGQVQESVPQSEEIDRYDRLIDGWMDWLVAWLIVGQVD